MRPRSRELEGSSRDPLSKYRLSSHVIIISLSQLLLNRKLQSAAAVGVAVTIVLAESLPERGSLLTLSILSPSPKFAPCICLMSWSLRLMLSCALIALAECFHISSHFGRPRAETIDHFPRSLKLRLLHSSCSSSGFIPCLSSVVQLLSKE